MNKFRVFGDLLQWVPSEIKFDNNEYSSNAQKRSKAKKFAKSKNNPKVEYLPANYRRDWNWVIVTGDLRLDTLPTYFCSFNYLWGTPVLLHTCAVALIYACTVTCPLNREAKDMEFVSAKVVLWPRRIAPLHACAQSAVTYLRWVAGLALTITTLPNSFLFFGFNAGSTVSFFLPSGNAIQSVKDKKMPDLLQPLW